jgi:hypothetical protein
MSKHKSKHQPKQLKVGGKAVAPSVDITDIQQDGAVLIVMDAANNPVHLDPAKSKVDWKSSDENILTVTVDSNDQMVATVSSTGELGSATLSAQITSSDASHGTLDASVQINVTTSAPTDALIMLGTPTNTNLTSQGTGGTPPVTTTDAGTTGTPTDTTTEAPTDAGTTPAPTDTDTGTTPAPASPPITIPPTT